MKVPPDQDVTSALRSLVRQGGAASFQPERRQGSRDSREVPHSGPDLKTLLNQRRSNPTNPDWPPRRDAVPSSPNAADAARLHELLRANDNQQVWRKTADVSLPQAPLADIKALAGRSPANFDANPVRPATTKRPDEPRRALSRLAHQEVGNEDAPDEVAAPTSIALGRRFGLSLAALFCLIVAAAAWQYRASWMPRAAPKSLSEQVRVLGQAVDAYRKDHGALPPSLHELAEFPKNAVDLPPSYYSATMLDDHAEFFLTRLRGDEFSIVGRYGQEAWAYVDGRAGVVPVPPH